MTEWGKTRHGTNSGYSTHQHLNERPCDPCFNAKKAYVARRYADPERLKRRQFTSRAQGVATTKLRAMFPEIYQALYTAAKEELTTKVTGSPSLILKTISFHMIGVSMSDTVLAVEVDGHIVVGDTTYGVFYPDYQSVYFGYDVVEARDAVEEYNSDHLLNDGSNFPVAYIVEVSIK